MLLILKFKNLSSLPSIFLRSNFDLWPLKSENIVLFWQSYLYRRNIGEFFSKHQSHDYLFQLYDLLVNCVSSQQNFWKWGLYFPKQNSATGCQENLDSFQFGFLVMFSFLIDEDVKNSNILHPSNIISFFNRTSFIRWICKSEK